MDCSECKYFQFDEDYEGNDMSWCGKGNDLYTECCEDFTDVSQAEVLEYTINGVNYFQGDNTFYCKENIISTRVNYFHSVKLIYIGESIGVNDVFIVTKVSNAGVKLTRVQMFDKV
jgi:hypothetical protein